MIKKEIEKIKAAFEPNEALVKQVKEQGLKSSRRLRRIGLSLGVVIAVSISGIMLLQNALSSDGNNPKYSIVGLPKGDGFVVTDKIYTSETQLDSLAYIIESIDDWFKHEMDAIAIVKVTDIGETHYTLSQSSIITPLSLEVLETVYGEVNGTLEATSYGFSPYSMSGLEYPNQEFRLNGVYILPLYTYEGEWRVSYQNFVLFEIDDQGLLDSHSSFEALKSYDGYPYTVLIDDLKTRINDPDFILRNSQFGQGYEKFEFIKGTILKVESDVSHFEHSNVIRISIQVNQGYGASDIGPEIEVYLYENTLTHPLEVGTQYLMFINRYLGYEGNTHWMARIDEQNTIQSYGIYFNQFDGLSVDNVINAVNRLDQLKND